MLCYIRIRWALGEKIIENNLAIGKSSDLNNNIDILYRRVETHVNNAKISIVKSINTEMVKAYWLIGRDLVIHEQEGEDRAEYGKSIIKEVSKRLQKEYGRGFSARTLFDARKFYIKYQKISEVRKVQTVSAQFKCPEFSNKLSWSHYIELINI